MAALDFDERLLGGAWNLRHLRAKVTSSYGERPKIAVQPPAAITTSIALQS
jgi:hypothetical protein